MFTARFDKNVYDKNILVWQRNFAFSSFFPYFFLASVANQWQSVHGTPLNATSDLTLSDATEIQKFVHNSACFHFFSAKLLILALLL